MQPKYTREVHTTIVEGILEGLCKKHAAALAGISDDTLEAWLTDGREQYADFARDVERAQAEFARDRMREIMTSARAPQFEDTAAKKKKRKRHGDWKAAAWILERRFPLIYGNREGKRDDAPKQADADKPFSPWGGVVRNSRGEVTGRTTPLSRSSIGKRVQ